MDIDDEAVFASASKSYRKGSKEHRRVYSLGQTSQKP
jgi:hypothetical protein